MWTVTPPSSCHFTVLPRRTLSSAARHGQLEFSTDEIHYFDATQMDNPAVASVLLFIYLLFIYLSIYLLRCLIIELEW